MVLINRKTITNKERSFASYLDYCCDFYKKYNYRIGSMSKPCNNPAYKIRRDGLGGYWYVCHKHSRVKIMYSKQYILCLYKYHGVLEKKLLERFKSWGYR